MKRTILALIALCVDCIIPVNAQPQSIQEWNIWVNPGLNGAPPANAYILPPDISAPTKYVINPSGLQPIPLTAGGTVNAGTTGQVGYYAGNGTAISGTSALPNGTMATTQAGADNTTKVATDQFVQSAVAGLTSPILYATKTINAGQISNAGTAIPWLAAPGASSAYVIHRISCLTTFGSAQWTKDVQLWFGDHTNEPANDSALGNATATQNYYAAVQGHEYTGTPASFFYNQPITIQTGDGLDPTGGAGTSITFQLWYSVIP